MVVSEVVAQAVAVGEAVAVVEAVAVGEAVAVEAIDEMEKQPCSDCGAVTVQRVSYCACVAAAQADRERIVPGRRRGLEGDVPRQMLVVVPLHGEYGVRAVASVIPSARCSSVVCSLGGWVRVQRARRIPRARKPLVRRWVAWRA